MRRTLILLSLLALLATATAAPAGAIDPTKGYAGICTGADGFVCRLENRPASTETIPRASNPTYPAIP